MRGECLVYPALVKILFTRFPLESRLGGAEMQTLSLMEGLRARGHAVAFAGSCPVLLNLCKEKNIPAVEWKIGPPPVTKWGAVSFLWRSWFMKKNLLSLLSQFEDIDAVCMLSLSEKLLLTESAALQKKKVLWIEHDRIGRWLSKNPWLSLLKKQSEFATVVAVSELSKRMLTSLRFDFGRIKVIPNGIDTSRFSRLPEAVPGRPFAVGCVARLTRDKGVQVLVSAAAGIPGLPVIIIGDGPDRDFLLYQIHATGQAERIRIEPSLPDLGAFYRSVDVLVLPSVDNDPFGMVAAEAMLCGTAVIVTDQCGIAGYLENEKDELVIPAGDADALKNALLKLKNDASFRQNLAEAGQKTAQEKFTLPKMIDLYEAVLR